MTIMDDLRYLEQAEVHADEGPLGEPAARSILQIALRLARQQQAIDNPVTTGCPRASRLHAPLRFCPDCPEGEACKLPAEPSEASTFEAMKAEEARIMQDWRWGNLTVLGVANHLRRAGFDSRYATDKANSLATPAPTVDETDRLREAIDFPGLGTVPEMNRTALSDRPQAEGEVNRG